MLLMQDLWTNPYWKGVLRPNRPDARPPTNWEPLVDAGVQIQERDFFLNVDAASLIFAHSVLDDAALQFCRVTAEASPNMWERFVREKKISLKEVRNSTYESLFRQKLDDYFNKLERESLMAKVQKMFEVCQPDANFRPIREFSYDKSRLESLDKLRHDIVHGTGPVAGLPNGDDDIRFMQSCLSYLMMLVHERFGVQIDERFMDLRVPGPPSS